VTIACVYQLITYLIHGNTWRYQDYINISIIAIAGVTVISMFVMIVQQIYLISVGVTTNESIRRKYPTHVFDEGCCKNWSNALNPVN
jgi:hypothetical protein